MGNPVENAKHSNGPSEKTPSVIESGSSISGSFPTLQELADEQGVSPLESIETLFGTWPNEQEDGFEEEVQRLRKMSATGYSTL